MTTPELLRLFHSIETTANNSADLRSGVNRHQTRFIEKSDQPCTDAFRLDKHTPCDLASQCAGTIHTLLQTLLDAERARIAAEDAAMWSRYFSENASSNKTNQTDRIVQIASVRAFLAILVHARQINIELIKKSMA